jgi:hypothetical protein
MARVGAFKRIEGGERAMSDTTCFHVVLDIFAPPREEYRTAGKGLGL